jgi:hypothetical protein
LALTHETDLGPATQRAIATAVAASAVLLACGNGPDHGQESVTAVPAPNAAEMKCEAERAVMLPSVADLARSSTIVITARATTSHTTTVTAPLPNYAPKDPPAPTTIPPNIGPNQWTPPEDRRDDPALQGRGYLEFYFTDTTIVVDSVLKGSADFVGRTITNRTMGDDVNECTTLDPPAARGKSQLFFLLHEPVSDTYFTTTGSLYGRFEINDGRVTASGQTKYAQESPVATELDGKTIAEVRRLI